MQANYEGTAISMSAKENYIHSVTINNCSFDCNGVGYYCAEGMDEIKGVLLRNCSFSVTPKTKYWGDDYSDGTAKHCLSMPYALVAKNVKELTLENVSVACNKALFTDTLSSDLQKK